MSAQLGVPSIVTIVAAACGGLLMLITAHANEPKHSEAAHEDEVRNLAVRLERVATEVDHNSQVLTDLREDLGALRSEQQANTTQILNAIQAR